MLGVPQRMRADTLGEAGGPERLLDDARELARADRLDRVLPRAQLRGIGTRR